MNFKNRRIMELAQKQLTDQKDQGKTIINPTKRVLKNKPYKNRDFQSIYEYTRINLGKTNDTRRNKKSKGR